ncbi:hypothetical protein HZS_5914 [Henneguya salminicola]|nr:hypothetical protein HZS_5914 [Henneguya salminicola]
MDGVLTIYIDEKTLKTLPNSETLWNFHAWNLAYMLRRDVNILLNEVDKNLKSWQHIDATPQERSQGTYQCGPYELSLLKMKIFDKNILYDGPSIYNSMNARLKYVMLDETKKVVRKYDKKNCGALIVTFGPYGEKIDITSQYISFKCNPPTDKESTERIILDLTVPHSARLGETVKYAISASNAADNLPTTVSLIMEVRNNFGKNIGNPSDPIITLVFNEKNINYSGETEICIPERKFDLSMLTIYWELRFFDSFLNKYKVRTRLTKVLQCFNGSITNKVVSIASPNFEIHLNVKSEINFDVYDCSVFVKSKNSKRVFKSVIPIFQSKSEQQLNVGIEDVIRGYQTIELWIECDFYCSRLAKKHFLVIY